MEKLTSALEIFSAKLVRFFQICPASHPRASDVIAPGVRKLNGLERTPRGLEMVVGMRYSLKILGFPRLTRILTKIY